MLLTILLSSVIIAESPVVLGFSSIAVGKFPFARFHVYLTLFIVSACFYFLVCKISRITS
jgi:hypothetical protein